MKMLIFVMLAFTISAFLFVSGITKNEGSALGIINQLITTGDATGIDIYTYIFGIAFLTLSGFAIATSLTFGNAGSATVLGSLAMSTLLAQFMSDFLFVINKARQSCDIGSICSNWVYWVLFLIFIPIIIGYLISLFDYAVGND